MTLPGSKAAWPKSAACESPIALAIGMPAAEAPARDRAAEDAARRPDLGQDARGNAKESSSSASHAAARRLKSCVRDALVASHAWTAPPVKFHSSQLSIVPAHSSPRCGTAVAIGDRVEQPADLAGGEQRVDRQPGPLFDETSAGRDRAASAQNGAVRRHCQTMTGPTGRPVARSQTQHRLALVGDPDGVDMPARRRALRHSSMASSTLRQSASRVLLDPTRLRERNLDRPRGARHDLAASSNEQDLRVGRALVDREDVPSRTCRSAPAPATAPRRGCLPASARSAPAGTPAEPVGANTPGTPSRRIRTGCDVDDHFRHRAPEPAVDGVLLDGHDRAARGGAHDAVAVDRPDRREVEHGRADAVLPRAARPPRARGTP